MDMTSMERSRKLAVARQQFRTSTGKVQYGSREQNTDERRYMPYWANYLFRTFLTLFLLLCFYLYGVSDSGKRQEIVKAIRENVNSNPSILEACETYSKVDYQDAYEKMVEYAKSVWGKK